MEDKDHEYWTLNSKSEEDLARQIANAKQEGWEIFEPIPGTGGAAGGSEPLVKVPTTYHQTLRRPRIKR